MVDAVVEGGGSSGVVLGGEGVAPDHGIGMLTLASCADPKKAVSIKQGSVALLLPSYYTTRNCDLRKKQCKH